MKDSLFQSLFGNAITDETNLESTKQRFEMLFGYKRAVLERLISSKQFAAKRSPGGDDDMALVMKIARDQRDRLAGSMLKELRQNPGEDRRSEERRQRPRRVSQQRTGFPERRLSPERRHKIRRREDLELVLKLAREKCDSVKRPIFEDVRVILTEQRKSGDRRMRLRQDDSGQGGRFPERRKKIRRKEDQEYFENLIFRNAEVPIGFRAYNRDTGDHS
jgi:hypothetical protein